jgi:hypothetical protein
MPQVLIEFLRHLECILAPQNHSIALRALQRFEVTQTHFDTTSILGRVENTRATLAFRGC